MLPSDSMVIVPQRSVRKILSVYFISLLIVSSLDSKPVRMLITLATILAFLGFVFFLIGRRLGKGDKTVRLIGYLDLLATVLIVAFYVLAIYLFGL